MATKLSKQLMQVFPVVLLKTLRSSDVQTTDVNFVFDVVDPTDGKTKRKLLPAHKLILAGGSNVFQSMFYGALKETKDIQIVDFSFDDFRVFIDSFYLANPGITKENILEVIRAVDKYDVRGCLPICETFLLDVIDEDNVCDVLEAALKFNLSKNITEKVAAVIKGNTSHVFRSSGFKFCDKEVLKSILQMDTLSCRKELDVCKASMDWAIKLCLAKNKPVTDFEIRKELGECFALLRFTTLDADEFLELTELHPKLFQYEEFSDILQNKVRRKPLKLFADFNSTQRSFEVEIAPVSVHNRGMWIAPQGNAVTKINRLDPHLSFYPKSSRKFFD